MTANANTVQVAIPELSFGGGAAPGAPLDGTRDIENRDNYAN